jgi:hypothetical protein
MTSHIRILKEKFIAQLLTGYYTDEKEIHEHIRSLGLNIDTSWVIPIILEIDDYLQIKANRGLKGQALLEFAITNIIEEILVDQDNGTVSHIANGKFIILLSFTW